jgi:hypothetical protein
VERPDAAFSATYYGGEKEDWDALNSGAVVDGGGEAYARLLELAAAGFEDDAAYLALQGEPDLPAYLDVLDYADYMITNLYVGNTDWPQKNFWVGRRPGGDGFKAYMWDSEWSLGLRSNLDTNRIGVTRGVAAPWAALRANAEFRVLVGDRAHRHFFNGGALYVDPQRPAWDREHPERNRPAARLVALANRVERALVAESARWGDQHAGTPYTVDEHWRPELERLLADYFPARSARVVDQLRAAGMYPELAAPRFSVHGGVVAPDFALVISAPDDADADLLYTLDGTDPRLPGGGASAEAILAEGPIPLGDAAQRVIVRARARTGAQWSALNEAHFEVEP